MVTFPRIRSRGGPLRVPRFQQGLTKRIINIPQLQIVELPDPAELFYVAGLATGTTQIFGETLNGTGGGTDAWMGRAFADGTVQWLAEAKSDSYVESNCTPVVDPEDGSVYWGIAVQLANGDSNQLDLYNADGSLATSITSFTASPVGTVHREYVIAKYDIDGNFLVGEHVIGITSPFASLGSTFFWSINGMVLDKAGGRLMVLANPYVSGFNLVNLEGSVEFGPGDPNEISVPRATDVFTDEPLNQGSQRPHQFWLDPDTLQMNDGTNNGRGDQIYGISADGFLQILGGMGLYVGNFSQELGAHKDADVTVETYIQPNGQTYRAGFFTDVGRTQRIPAALNSNVSTQTNVRWLIRDKSNNNAILTGFGLAQCDPGATNPLVDAEQYIHTRGGMSAVDSNGDIVVAAYMQGINAGKRARFFWNDAWLPEVMPARNTDERALIVARFGWNGTTLTQRWARYMPMGQGGSDGNIRTLIIDEDNDALYLFGNNNGTTTPIGYFWDGASFNEGWQTSTSRPGGLARLNYTTGATEWAMPFEMGSGSSAQPISIAQADDYLYAIIRWDHAAAARNRAAVLNSNLAKYTPGVIINATASTEGRQTTVVQIDKINGIVVDYWNASDLRPSATGDLVAYAATPTNTTGVGSGTDLSARFLNSDVFHIEAASPYGINFDASDNLGNARDTSVPNYAGSGNPHITSRPTTLSFGIYARSTGGPGGYTNADDCYLEWSGSNGQNINYISFGGLAQNKRFIAVFYVDDLSTDRYIFDEATPSANRWQLYVASDGSVVFNAGSNVSSAASAVTTGQWYWLVGDVNGASSQFELNTGTTWSGDCGSNTFDSIRVGTQGGGSGLLALDGRLAHLSIMGNKSFAEAKAYTQARWSTL